MGLAAQGFRTSLAAQYAVYSSHPLTVQELNGPLKIFFREHMHVYSKRHHGILSSIQALSSMRAVLPKKRWRWAFHMTHACAHALHKTNINPKGELNVVELRIGKVRLRPIIIKRTPKTYQPNRLCLSMYNASRRGQMFALGAAFVGMANNSSKCIRKSTFL